MMTVVVIVVVTIATVLYEHMCCRSSISGRDLCTLFLYSFMRFVEAFTICYNITSAS